MIIAVSHKKFKTLGIREIKKFGKRAGVSLNPETSIKKLIPIINSIDLVLQILIYK